LGPPITRRGSEAIPEVTPDGASTSAAVAEGCWAQPSVIIATAAETDPGRPGRE